MDKPGCGERASAVLHKSEKQFSQKRTFCHLESVDDIPGIGRKVTSIHEIGYDFENRRVTAEPIVKYDIRKSKWIWYKTIGDEAISTMSRRGVPMEKIDKMNSYIESMIKGNSEQRS